MKVESATARRRTLFGPAMVVNAPLRLVDYFFVAGISANADLAARRTESTCLNSTPRSSTSSKVGRTRSEADVTTFGRLPDAPGSPATTRRPSTPSTSINPATFADAKILTHALTDAPLNFPAAPRTPKTPVNPDKKPHPIDYGYQPELLVRYPENDWTEPERFPTFTTMFCFPNDLRFGYANGPKPIETYHSFVITQETGVKLYGVCLTLYEKLPVELASQLETMVSAWTAENIVTTDVDYVKHIQRQLDTAQERLKSLKQQASELGPGDSAIFEPIVDLEDKVTLYLDLLAPLRRNVLFDCKGAYMPRCLGLLSHWPWHDLLKDWLTEVVYCLRNQNALVEDSSMSRYKNVVSKLRVPLERYLINLIHEIPLPPPGKLEVSISVGRFHLYCSRPPANSISVMQNFSIYPVFRTLSIPHIVTLFELVLSERKIILLSSHLMMLTLTAETLCILIYPFTWQHIYIPILPAKLLSYLQAPVPYIVGIHREFYIPDGPDPPPPDASVIDLDNDVITFQETPSLLPTHERKKLLTRLHKYSGATGLLTVNSALGGSTGSLSSRRPRGVPLSTLKAFPNDKTCPSSADSYKRVPCENTESIYNKSVPVPVPVPAPGLGPQPLTARALSSSQMPKIGSGSLGALSTQTATPSGSSSNVGTILDRLKSLATYGSISSLSKSESQDSMHSLEPMASQNIPATPLVSRPPPMPIPSRDSTLQSPARGFAWAFGSTSPRRTSFETNSAVSTSPEHKEFPPPAHHRFSSEIAGRPGLVRGAGHRRQASEGSGRTWLQSMMASQVSSAGTISTSNSNPSLTASKESDAISVQSDTAANATSMYFKSLFQPRPRSVLTTEVTLISTTSADNQSPLSPSASTYSMSSASSLPSETSMATQDSTLLSALANKAREKFLSGHQRHQSLQITLPSSAPSSPSRDTPSSFQIKSADESRTPARPHYCRRNSASGMTGPRPASGSRRSSHTPDRDRIPSPLIGSPESTQSVASFGAPEKLVMADGQIGAALSRLSQSIKSSPAVTHVAPMSLPQSKRKEGHVFWEVNVSELVKEVAADDGDGEYAKRSVTRESLEASRNATVLCRVCYVDLRIDENGKGLKCELCYMKCHTSCFSIAECRPCPTLFSERKVRNAFLKVFTSLMKSYRQCLTMPAAVKSVMTRGVSFGSVVDVDTQGLSLQMEDWFKKEEFLASCDREAKQFMVMFVETQAFAQFTLERIERPETDHEILFFDECIKAKLNRSQLRLKKEATPFLTDTSYAITQTFHSLAPNIEDIDLSDVAMAADSFPSILNEQLLVPPRFVQSLITASDQKMMRSHIAGLVQRARMATTMRRKQDFSKWMRGRWKMFQQLGNGEVVSIGFLSDEQRREMLEDRLRQVANVIDKFEASHLSSQQPEEVRKALRSLYAQNDVLIRATDEEQLVDAGDQQEVQLTMARLFRVITIYEEFASTLPSPPPTLETPMDVAFPPLDHRESIVDGFTEDVLQAIGISIAENVNREMSSKRTRPSKPLPTIPSDNEDASTASLCTSDTVSPNSIQEKHQERPCEVHTDGRDITVRDLQQTQYPSCKM
ncbi:hypothetical protein SeMB42_g07288 [Synchytrium endobioticum]|uniref:UDENN domain-containing protein n=1 Tax=Synchytrium endobioticum TaxID=286115 RepID=A0A507C0L7_9FUNG|nr:hypothetical protein SeMB42_g07288 [Synchytrium endobioticum]